MSAASQPIANESPCLLPAPRRRLWLTLLLTVLVFVSGLVVGGGATLIVVRNRVLHAIRHPEEAPPRIAAQLRWKLGLSEEQASQVEEIVRTRQRALQAIRREVQPRVVTELDGVESEIAAVLDDAQRTKWHAMFSQLRDTWLPPPPKAE